MVDRESLNTLGKDPPTTAVNHPREQKAHPQRYLSMDSSNSSEVRCSQSLKPNQLNGLAIVQSDESPKTNG